MAVEIYKILNGMSPEYLSSLFSKSNVPCQLRDSNKFIQPLKRTTTFGRQLINISAWMYVCVLIRMYLCVCMHVYNYICIYICVVSICLCDVSAYMRAYLILAN